MCTSTHTCTITCIHTHTHTNTHAQTINKRQEEERNRHWMRLWIEHGITTLLHHIQRSRWIKYYTMRGWIILNKSSLPKYWGRFPKTKENKSPCDPLYNLRFDQKGKTTTKSILKRLEKTSYKLQEICNTLTWQVSM